MARIGEQEAELHSFLAAGFTEYNRMFTSRLELETLDLNRFAAKEASVRAADLQVLSVAGALGEGGWDEAARRRLFRLIVSRIQDVPGTVPIQPWTFEVWQERVGHKLDPRGVFVAVNQEGDWVGLTELFLELEPGVLHTGLTGVEPAWQGQGVAYALKLAALRAARERGYTRTLTSNHSRNASMLAVNRALGFVPDPATLMLRRDLHQRS
ncbi:GNAT family N-acetyltransferase [Deinococcus radiophilus]|uniref:GNAT family N-acetyltransferase n=2 Tax=Deinococcus radiophilus TaxID=32062 RepID=A0A431VQJ9_9DEIO|nr:GNAT family N-acetyltransferase [Deinococcus radiophilus]